MATITKRGKGWFVQVRRKGVTKCSTWPTKRQAEVWATQTEAEILAGEAGKIVQTTFRDALERYADEVSPSKRGKRWELTRLNAFCRLPIADYRLADVTTPVLATWRDERLICIDPSSLPRTNS